jgi:Putative Flp pilus-assembly TadE/G-like
MRIRSANLCLHRPGGVSVWLVLGLTGILGVLALGMDGGRMQEERRRAQATADAAALAAAADLYENWWTYHGKDHSSSAQNAALKAAAANGYANDGTTSVVTVNTPPATGTFAGQAEYVEVIAEYRLGTTFGRIFTNKDLPVEARAVARGRPAKIGLLLLSPAAGNAFLNKSLAFAVLGNPIIVNSTDNQALNQAGLGLLVASRYDITGNFVNSGGIILGKMNTGVRPTADPLRKLPAPNVAASPVQSNKQLVINSLLPTILKPGVYQGGIKIQGASVVTMLPGVYILEGGGLQVQNLATLAGLDVMIYNTAGVFPAGPITISSLGKMVLTAPLSGTYQGISVFQDRAVSQPLTVTGAGLMAFTGTVYAPSADVTLGSIVAAGIDTLGGAYICNTISISGIGSINLDLGNNPPRIPEVTLVE